MDAAVAAVAAVPPPVLVLLSGGRDSVCLLDLAVRAHGRAAVRALHVNHGLRPDAGEDEALCSALCARLGVELVVERAPAPPPGGNRHAWARELRYAAAARHARGARVLVAHTRSDQAETVLYRLASSPSRRALLGMRGEDGRLHRPLLGVSRAETAAWCRARDLPWREDPANADLRYARTRTRAGLLPALRALHPAAEENVTRAAAVLRDEAEVLDALVAAETGGDAIRTERLAGLHPALARLVVQELADRAAGALVPGAARRAPEVVALGANGALDVGGGVRAVARRGVLTFAASEGRAARREAPT